MASRVRRGANVGRRPIPAWSESCEEPEEYVVNILLPPLVALYQKNLNRLFTATNA